MGFLDAKAAAKARRKPVDAFSAAPAARHTGEPLKRAAGAPRRVTGPLPSMGSGEPQANRASVVVHIRDRAQIWTTTPGAEIGLELPKAHVARWPENLRDDWEERSAILEYDEGLPRPIAERRAYQIIRDANEAALLMAEAEQ